MTEIRERAAAGIEVGDEFRVMRRFSEADVKAFAAVSRDDNPIHYYADFIEAKQMSAPICHGLLVASLLTEVGGQIGWLASGMDLKFKKPVYVEETVTCVFKVTEIGAQNRARAEVQFFNGKNEVVIDAVLTGILPNEAEREILRKLANREKQKPV